MKHIDIVNSAKVNGEIINWVATIPSKHLRTCTVDGYTIITTNRNYYLDTKAMKVRYQTMTTENASYDSLVDVYVEVYPGLYYPFGVATENNITDKLQSAAKVAKTLNPGHVDDFRKSLVRIGK